MSIVRKAIETQYKGVCTVTEYQSTRDETTKRTTQKEVVVLENQPCKLSFKSVTSTNDNENLATVGQSVKMFIAPEIKIKPGSKVSVIQNGVTTEYSQSGEPATYTHHQEIILELFKGWT